MHIRPLAAIVDHDLRPESMDEACRVAELAKSLHLEPHLSKVAWGTHPPSKGQILSLARAERYKAIYRTCLQNDSHILLTGHHAGKHQFQQNPVLVFLKTILQLMQLVSASTQFLLYNVQMISARHLYLDSSEPVELMD